MSESNSKNVHAISYAVCGQTLKIQTHADVEIMASCSQDHKYSRNCGNFFLKANQSGTIQLPETTSHFHVRTAIHEGDHTEIGPTSDWKEISLR